MNPNSLKRVVFLALCCVPSGATTVVILTTRQEIVVAADSAVQGKGKLNRSTYCKILQAGDVFLATEGMAEIDIPGGNGHESVSFIAMKVATRAVKIPGSIAYRVGKFENEANHSFQTAVARLKEVDPEAYGHWLRDKPQALQVAFIYLNADKLPAYTVLAFGVSEDKRGVPAVTVVTSSCPGKGCGEPLDLQILGEWRKAAELSKRPGFPGSDLVTAARSLVQAEIKNNPKLVRGPIDLVRLSLLGRELSLKKQCTAQEQRINKGSTKQAKK
jgi:hypothetical protein